MGAYKQRALELFDLLDADRSGFIDAGDVARADGEASAARQRKTEEARSFTIALVRAADVNKDGKVSKEEMLAYVERSMVGRTPETLPDFVRHIADAAFGLMDTDRTGKVDKAEFEQYLALPSHNTPAASAADEFTQLDRDGDGTLTVVDLHIATHAFFTDPCPGCPEQWLLTMFTA
ncbi:EF-hand domain-containing protein [Streptomyces anulatus]|uniref:EF-hand domain-containing protein n=1 Tax=Streptomyces anulatus TaxID=1892 RepID=UPI00341B7333